MPESERFRVEGWFEGASDCEPPEPGKQWLTVMDRDQEFCVIVLRDPGTGITRQQELERENRAELIVNALNAFCKDES